MGEKGKPEPARTALQHTAETTACIWDVKPYALHDGPGIRTTVFFKGCPLRCRWCCNPESQQFTAELVWIAGNCIGCGECTTVCPREAISVDAEGRRHIDVDRCDHCGRCVAACPGEALRLFGESRSVADLLDTVLRDEGFHWRSGGGLTLSGGEPLAQIDAACTLLADYREAAHGHTAVETCGHVPWADLDRAHPLVDLFLYDVKHLDPEAHRQGTGTDNRRILANLERLCRTGARVIPRIPLVPGFNDEPASLQRLAAHLAALPGVDEAHIMPYHRLGAPKYPRLGRAYSLDDLRPPSPDRIETARRILQHAGLAVCVGG